MLPQLILLTDEGWWDTDISIIPYLKNFFHLKIYVILNKKKHNKFSKDEINLFIETYNVDIEIWSRPFGKANPLNLFMFKRLFSSMKLNNKKDALLNYVYTYDPYLNFFIFFSNYFNKLITIHDYIEHVGMENFIRRTLKKIIILRHSFFHFYSKIELNKFQRDFPQKKSFNTEMPLKNFGEIHNCFSPRKSTDGKIRFLFFGFIRHYKGLDILLDAIGKIESKNYQLTIAGFAYNWNEYEMLIDKNINIITNIKYLSNNEGLKLFEDADFIILPYRDTTQSGPILLALNYNIPVIASDIELFKIHITDSVDGFLFSKENSDSLKNVLNTALSLTEMEYLNLKINQEQKAIKLKRIVACSGEIFKSFVSENIQFS